MIIVALPLTLAHVKVALCSRIRFNDREEVANNHGRSVIISKIILQQIRHAHILYISRLIVNEKQHLISSFEFGSGFFKEQVVKIAFWFSSKAMAPNLSQYDTRDFSAMM